MINTAVEEAARKKVCNTLNSAQSKPKKVAQNEPESDMDPRKPGEEITVGPNEDTILVVVCE